MVTQAIINHYTTAGGKWPAWRDAPWIREGSKPLALGRTVALRMQNYTRLCKQSGKELTSEPGGAWQEGECLYGCYPGNCSPSEKPTHYRPVRDSIILRNCSSWARFVQSDDTEREQLEGDTAKALEFWAMVRTELTTGL
mgnify:CR=1 FL=1